MVSPVPFLFILSKYSIPHFKNVVHKNRQDDLECPPRCSGHFQRKNIFIISNSEKPAELVGAKPLHPANARPFCRLKAPLGLSLLRNRGLFGVTFSREGVVAMNCICWRSLPCGEYCAIEETGSQRGDEPSQALCASSPKGRAKTVEGTFLVALLKGCQGHNGSASCLSLWERCHRR